MRELINHGADVNAEDAVSHYQMFIIDVKVIISQEFVHNTCFCCHLVLLQYSKIIVWCFGEKTHFYDKNLIRICLCLHVWGYEMIKYLLFFIFMAHVFVTFNIIVVYRRGVCQSCYTL